MIKPTFIYALCEPGTRTVRYIGMSKNPKKRLRGHLREGMGTHKGHWILKLAALGLVPSLEILDEIPSEGWEFFERAYIKVHREAGFNLVNGTDGGDGCYNPTPETRAKMSKAKAGRVLSPETLARMSKAQLGRVHPLEVCKKISVARRGMVFSLEHCRNLSVSHRGNVPTAEARQNMSKAQQIRREREKQIV